MKRQEQSSWIASRRDVLIGGAAAVATLSADANAVQSQSEVGRSHC